MGPWPLVICSGHVAVGRAEDVISSVSLIHSRSLPTVDRVAASEWAEAQDIVLTMTGNSKEDRVVQAVWEMVVEDCPQPIPPVLTCILCDISLLRLPLGNVGSLAEISSRLGVLIRRHRMPVMRGVPVPWEPRGIELIQGNTVQ